MSDMTDALRSARVVYQYAIGKDQDRPPKKDKHWFSSPPQPTAERPCLFQRHKDEDRKGWSRPYLVGVFPAR